MNRSDFLDFLSEKDCVFWDWNGTLLNDLDYSLGVTNGILDRHGIKTLSKDYYQKHFTIPVVHYYNHLGLEKSQLSFDELSKLFIKNYMNSHHTLELFPGARDCLNHLNSRNVKQVLFSAAHIDEIIFQVQHHKLEQFFQVLSGADNHSGGCKLDRGLLIKKEHGFDCGALVGDTLHDIEIGKALGFDTIWVSDGHQSLERALNSSEVDYIYNRSNDTFLKKDLL